MTSVDVPMPVMFAPIATRNSQRSVISGSRAALSMRVTPSASTAAVSRFSVAPTRREVEGDVGAVEPVGERLEVPVAELERGPHRFQARHVHVDRTGTEIVAARQ